MHDPATKDFGWAVFWRDGLAREMLMVFTAEGDMVARDFRTLDAFDRVRHEVGDPAFAEVTSRELEAAMAPEGPPQTAHVEYFHDRPSRDGSRSVLVNVDGWQHSWLVVDDDGDVFDGARFPSPEDEDADIGLCFAEFLMRRVAAGDRRLVRAPADGKIRGIGDTQPSGGWSA